MIEKNKSIGNFPNCGNSNNVPRLRFAEFTDEWEEVTLGNCSESIDYGMNASATKFDGENKYIRITDIDESSSKYKSEFPVSPAKDLIDKFLVKENDILFARTGASTGKSYIYDSNDGKLYFAGFLIRAKIKSIFNSHFIFLQTQTKKYDRWVKLMSMRSGQPGINSQEYSSYSFKIPKKFEQDKISLSLIQIDSRIHTQRKIIDNLEYLMLGFRKKIFTQKLRFKGSLGNDFPDWNESKLENICQKQSSNISANKIEDNFGDYIIYGASGVVKKVDFYEEENYYISIVKDGAGVGRLFFCEGKSSVLGTMEIIKPKLDVNVHFLFYQLNNIDFKKYVTGSTIPHIYFKDYKKESIKIPSLEEQTKIANFLFSIDKKLETEKKILFQYETQKKYLLANLFV